MRGRNRPDAVYHKSHRHGGHGVGAVHIAEIDVRLGEIAAAACCGDGDDKDAWVAANPYETISRRWKMPQKPLVALVVYVPALAVRTPILSAASVYHDRPNAMTAMLRMLKSVGEEDSIGLGDGLPAPHRLGNTDDMELDIAESPAYPKHWRNAA